MPVEIRELVIRVVVDELREGYQDEYDDGPVKDASDNKAIVEECVRQVLKILNKKVER